ncbi:MAG: glycosyltransferase family 39 protein [Thermodesulfobacteriota bacterium]
MAPVAVAVLAANLLLKIPAASADGIWLDEAVSLHVAQAPVSLATLAAAEPTPPLYYLLLCGWLRVFGFSLESARLLSVLLSSATAVLLLDLGRRHLDGETALVAAALFTSSKLQLHYAHEARCYALVGLLCVASFDVFLALVARPTRRKALALGLLNAALLYTHYVAVFALVAQLASAAVLARERRAFVGCYVASQGFAALLFTPWLVGLARDGISQKDWIGPPTLARARFVVKRFAGSSTLLTLWAAVAAAAVLGRRLRPAVPVDPAKIATLALWAFAPVLLAYGASFVRQTLLDRYVLYASLGLYLLLGYVVSLAPVSRASRALLAAALVGLSLWTTLAHPHRRHDWRTAVAVVREERALGATPVVAPDWHLRPLAWYLDRAAFRDHARTRERLEAAGVVPAEDVRALRLEPRRHVLVLGPDGAIGADAAQAWLEAQGFATIRRRELRGLTVLVVEPRPLTPAAGSAPRAAAR